MGSAIGLILLSIEGDINEVIEVSIFFIDVIRRTSPQFEIIQWDAIEANFYESIAQVNQNTDLHLQAEVPNANLPNHSWVGALAEKILNLRLGYLGIPTFVQRSMRQAIWCCWSWKISKKSLGTFGWNIKGTRKNHSREYRKS